MLKDGALQPADPEGVEPPRQVMAAAGQGRAALLTTVDQVLSSGSNALLLFAIAQVSSEAEFGAIGLLAVFVSTLLGFNRGALGSVVLLISHLDGREIRAESGYAVGWSLGMGIVAGFATVAGALWLGVGVLGVALAFSIPVALMQDVLRHTAIAVGRPILAVFSDGTWLLIMLVVYVINALWSAVSAELTVLVWGIGGFVAAALLATTLRVRPRYRRIFQWWLAYAWSRIRFGLVYALTMISATMVTFLVTLIMGTAAVAGLRGAATLFGPISMLVSAVPLVFIPMSRRLHENPRQQWRMLSATAVVTSGLTALVAFSVGLLPDAMGHAVLGESWYSASSVAPYIGLESACVCWLVSAYTLFQSLGLSRLLLRMRILQIVLQLGGCAAAAKISNNVQAVALSFAITAGVTAALAVMVASLVVRRRTSTASSDNGMSLDMGSVKGAA